MKAPSVPETQSSSLVADANYIFAQRIPSTHILRRVKEQIDFSFLNDRVAHLYSEKQGRPAISPELLGKVTFLQFHYKLSDRQVEEQCAQRLDFKFFLGLEVEADAPFDYSTLSRTRQRWGEETCRDFFEATVTQAQERGVLGRKRSIDSSKTLMNAAVLRAGTVLMRLAGRLLTRVHEAVPELPSSEAQAKLVERTAALMESEKTLREDTSWWLSAELKEDHFRSWEEQAAAVLECAGEFLSIPDPNCSALQQSYRRHITKLASILAKQLDDDQAEAAFKAAAKEGRKPRRVPNKLVSDVDPDARRAATKGGDVKAGYKTHVSVDPESEIITAIEVTPMNVDDGTQLLPLIKAETELGLEIKEVAADSAYSDGAIRAGLKEKEIQAHIPEPKPKGSRDDTYGSHEFTYDPATATVTCPQGHTASHGKEPRQPHGYQVNFPRAVCAACPLKGKCLSKKTLGQGIRHGRTVYISVYRDLHDEARIHQTTDEYREAMHWRLGVERKQSELLNIHGLRRARYRGLSNLRIQGYLTAAATNIKRLMKLPKTAENAPSGASLCLVT